MAGALLLSVIDTYLGRFATAETDHAEAIAAALGSAYRHVCVVPVLAEAYTLLDGLAPAGQGTRPLYILVVNATDAAGVAVHARNAELMSVLRTRARKLTEIAESPPMWLCQGLVAEASDMLLDVLLVDRASHGVRLAAGHGAGLPRSIGCDIALALGRRGAITSRWIHTTDADAILPAGYFAAADAAPPESVALTYPFWHQTHGPSGVALGLHEIALRYYALGLRWARSPYAHQTVSSALAVDAGAYATVRGFPRRRAGEDFHMLNRLARIGPVAQPRVAPIRIRPRAAERALVGGKGLARTRIADTLRHGRAFHLYHPRIFAALRRWHEILERFVRAPGPTLELAGPTELDAAEELALARAIQAIGGNLLLAAHAREATPTALARRVRGWFDALRTLKLIHALRDAGLHDMPWTQALARAPFVDDLPALEPTPAQVEQVRRRLFQLELAAER